VLDALGARSDISIDRYISTSHRTAPHNVIRSVWTRD
jgi:hypothetical protein